MDNSVVGCDVLLLIKTVRKHAVVPFVVVTATVGRY